MKLLYVNACTNRDVSRTCRLAEALISSLGDPDVEELVLEEEDLRPCVSKDMEMRNRASSENDFSDPFFRYAKQFMDSGVVVLASPYWESSYNGMMKLYLEHVSQVGLTFIYGENGVPKGLTSVKKLFYVTTRGGYCGDEKDLGYLNIKALAGMLSIPEVDIVSAEGLDIVGNDPEAILSESISKMTQN